MVGVGARESHDASAFYARFSPKSLSDDEDLAEPFELSEPLICSDARDMAELPDNSVALVVTSPPYFAGKAYEEALGEGLIPASYAEYLELLADVFAECRRVLEPGGRIAVNVANLGRKPYRSLSADVTRILDDDLGLLLRGEIVWKKADGASGSCAWGSYRSPTNPVLRDITERVVVASKGRFDRAVDIEERRSQGRPHEPSISTDEFLDATLDVWEIRPESARRVRHPAPFPVELPQRLIELYTFRDDLVLDPFLGSGSTAVAAVRTGRRYAGYDTDPEYVAIAAERVAQERALRSRPSPRPSGNPIILPETSGTAAFQSRSTEEGKAAQALAVDILQAAGFTDIQRDHRIPGVGITVNIVSRDADGEKWYFDVTGAFTSTRGGLVAGTDLGVRGREKSVHRLAGASMVIGAVMAITLSGCGTSQHIAGGPPAPASTTLPASSEPSTSSSTMASSSTAPSTTVASPTTTAPAPARGTCSASQLTIAFVGHNGAGGTGYYPFTVVNNGSIPCQIGGYFGVTVYDSAGHVITDQAARRPTTLGGRSPTQFGLAPGATASFTVSALENPATKNACPFIGSFSFIPPNATTSVRVAFPPSQYPFPECGNTSIYPTEPGTQGEPG